MTRQSRNPLDFGKLQLLSACLLLALAAQPAVADPDADAQAAETKKETQELEGVVVSAPNYVPRETNGAMKTNIPLIETPQSVTVIPRDQIDLLDWQNL